MPLRDWRVWLSGLFKLPTISEDGEKTAIARFLYYWTLIVLTIVVILLITLITPDKLSQPNTQRLPAVIAILGLIAALYLLRMERITWVILIHMIVGLQLLLPSLLSSGGIQAPGFSVLYVMLLFAGLFIGTQSVFAVAVFCSLFGLGLIWLQSNGYVTPPSSNPMEYWVAHTIYLFMVSLLFVLTNRSVRESLRRARYELAERVRAEGALQRANERLAFLHQVDQAILSVQSIDAVARAVAQRVKNTVKCDRVSVIGFDTRQKTSHLLSVIGIHPQRVVPELDSHLNEEGVMETLMHQRWFTREDMTKLTALTQIDRAFYDAGFISYATFSLVADGELIGLVNLASKDHCQYDSEQMELVREVCDALTLAMSQAELQKQVQEYTLGLEQRVNERTAQLQASNRELEAFAYSISHDLRAPLRSIDGFSQALAEDYGHLLENEAKEYLGRIRASSQRMGHLIDDMLKLSRITRSEMQFRMVDLAEMAREIRLELESSNPDREAHWLIPAELPVRADANLVRILLTNLISNAWKFTSSRKSAIIELGMQSEEGRNVYFVRDNGVGFDMQYAGKLFNAFQRLHSNEFEGTGIGLAIVQRIVRRHGGEVWVEAAVDSGATFYFTLAT